MRLFFGDNSNSNSNSRRRRRSLGWLSATAVALLAILGGNRDAFARAAAANNLFSSNVVTLTSSNWKEHVLDNPHMVLVNICRKG